MAVSLPAMLQIFMLTLDGLGSVGKVAQMLVVSLLTLTLASQHQSLILFTNTRVKGAKL
jgi:hypothetical protein